MADGVDEGGKFGPHALLGFSVWWTWKGSGLVYSSMKAFILSVRFISTWTT